MYKIIDKDTTYIDDNVVIGTGCIIYPNTTILGNTTIGDNTIIYPSSFIEDSTIGSNNIIYTSYILKSEIGNNNVVGPYAHVRPGNKINDNNKIGSFVEIKNSELDNHVKIPHLSYVGDSIVESNVNVGAGVKVANYDGKNKFKTHIQEDTFIGCNAVLVAPVTLHKRSFIAAGSTITEDVPEGTLAIARERQINKER